MRVAVCDDDFLFLEKTINYINNWTNKTIDLFVQGFNDGDSLINTHRKDPFDLIFMDVVMPMLNGIDTGIEIRTFDKNVKIVYLTTDRKSVV